MSYLTCILLSLLILLAITFSSSSAQPSSFPSSPLHKLRGRLAASIARLPYHLADTPTVQQPAASVEAEAEVGAPIGVASILPYRAVEEAVKQAREEESTVDVEEFELAATEETSADDEEDNTQPQPALPYGSEAEVKTTESAVLDESPEDATWRGEPASILPYRGTDADELREAAQEEEGSEFGVGSIVPFDSDKAVESNGELDLTAVESEEAASSSTALRESEWAKRSRVRRYRMRRWLLLKKAGEPVIYSQ